MHRRRRLILLVLTASTASAAAAQAANAHAPSACPGRFHVLHDDHIGALSVAGGQYKLCATGLSCAQASSAFAELLSDYNGDLACPGAFRCLHNDRVGRLSIPRGPYRITLLGPDLSCDVAERRFARFLRQPDGKLRGWTVLPDAGEFVRRSTTGGFRIKALRAA